jgi:UDP-2-acetamido-2-deoxy-ribo-hexuluronate aminotransferase
MTGVRKIRMVDLHSQYLAIKEEIDAEIQNVISDSQFINGDAVKQFAQNLGAYLDVKHVIPCGNGTDALQIAFMALDLPQGSEVLTPGFTYAALAEVLILLGLKPVYVDVEDRTFNIDSQKLEEAITPLTKAIAPVHLFGQCSNMDSIMALANKHGLKVVEDNAQAIGADCLMDGKWVKGGTIGDIGTTSFFPSKNLGCFGDGGAVYTNSDELAVKIKMIANHGQNKKYHHEVVGLNSRLDSIQAAVLNVKLKYLDEYCDKRRRVADYYDSKFSQVNEISTPVRVNYSTHNFHQYTLIVNGVERDELKSFLADKGIPTMVYYPKPLYRQNAYKQDVYLPNSEKLVETVISLPIDTEIQTEELSYIVDNIKAYLEK